MTKDKIKNRISMALKDALLQCAEIAQPLETEKKEINNDIPATR